MQNSIAALMFKQASVQSQFADYSKKLISVNK